MAETRLDFTDSTGIIVFITLATTSQMERVKEVAEAVEYGKFIQLRGKDLQTFEQSKRALNIAKCISVKV